MLNPLHTQTDSFDGTSLVFTGPQTVNCLADPAYNFNDQSKQGIAPTYYQLRPSFLTLHPCTIRTSTARSLENVFVC